MILKNSKKIKRIIAMMIIIVGIAILIYPYIFRKVTTNKINTTVNNFIGIINEVRNEDILYNDMKQYNRNLNENGQLIEDAFSYENPSFNLKEYGFEENIIGIIKIPKMNVELPIYLGATKENLYKGAVHLSQTSLPLGENSSNVVIAAHRSIVRHQMFQNIDKLRAGDEVIIKTLWETLTYNVTQKKVIAPEDSSQILIQKKKDLVTLVSCHPYGKTTERYIVYCERK